MRAVVISNGSLDVLERPTPQPGPHDVVVAVRAAGLNAADLLQRRGFYPAPPDWPADIPGLEMAGVVSAVGDAVDAPLLGRRVCAIVGGGAQATHCLVPANHLIVVPDAVSWDEAGGFAEAFATAHDALVTQGRLARGDRVLISGATGGVGTAAVQLAHALGCHVTAVTRTIEYHSRLRQLGADDTITLGDVGDVAPIDVVLELVGAAHLERAQTVLAPFARVVVIGVSGGGGTAALDLRTIMTRRATITGSTLRSRTVEEKAIVIGAVNETVVPLWISGQLRVPLDLVVPLDDVVSAYERFEQTGKLGKVVLRVDE